MRVWMRMRGIERGRQRRRERGEERARRRRGESKERARREQGESKERARREQGESEERTENKEREKGFDGKNIIDLGLTLPSIIIIYNGDAERWCHRMQFMTWKDD